MARIFITGSTDGLGLAAARTLIEDGHDVVLHARSEARAAHLGDIRRRASGIAIGDLSSAEETLSVAEQVDDIGRMDAVIHNAGIGYRESRRIATVDGHAHLLAINVLAPYLLTCRMRRPDRLVYLSSGMHRGGDSSLIDLDWTARPWNGTQAYSDSKLLDAALALAVARLWPDVRSNAVEPGWVATKMGGSSAPDDLAQGHVTQAWLAAGDDPAAQVTGEYLYHRQPRRILPIARDTAFQDALLEELRRLTGVSLPRVTQPA